MPTVKQLTIETVNLDDDREMDEFDRQVIAAGMERVRAEIRGIAAEGSARRRNSRTEMSSHPNDLKIK
jgi:hypothetical protein